MAGWIVNIMPDADSRTCEVKVGEAWRAVSVVEAHAHHGAADKRCPACHGRVIVAGNYVGTFSLKLAHRRNHPGCPTTPRGYTGTPTLHPHALA